MITGQLVHIFSLVEQPFGVVDNIAQLQVVNIFEAMHHVTVQDKNISGRYRKFLVIHDIDAGAAQDYDQFGEKFVGVQLVDRVDQFDRFDIKSKIWGGNKVLLTLFNDHFATPG